MGGTFSDADLHILVRAGRAVYAAGAAKALPDEIAATALEPVDDAGREVRVTDRDRAVMHRVQSDVRDGAPAGPFHLTLCRNSVFTTFDDLLQRSVAARLVERLHRGGALVLGGHETLPGGLPWLTPWPAAPCTFQRTA
jgi:chemotaxis protein methyltransferase CheR